MSTNTANDTTPASGYPKSAGSGKSTAFNRKQQEQHKKNGSSPAAAAKETAAELLDEEQQEKLIVEMLHDNLKGRKMMRRGIGVLGLFVALASLTLAWTQHETPYQELAAYFYPLSRSVKSGEIVYAVGLTCLSAIIQALDAFRRPAATKTNIVSFLLSLVPLIQWGWTFFARSLYEISWGFVWPAVTAFVLHVLEHYGHRVFTSLDTEVLSLTRLQYNLKSA